MRLRWGFLDERFPVDWLLPGEPALWNRLRKAGECRTPVEVVVGSAPGWSDPWSRVRQGTDLVAISRAGTEPMRRSVLDRARRVG